MYLVSLYFCALREWQWHCARCALVPARLRALTTRSGNIARAHTSAHTHRRASQNCAADDGKTTTRRITWRDALYFGTHSILIQSASPRHRRSIILCDHRFILYIIFLLSGRLTPGRQGQTDGTGVEEADRRLKRHTQVERLWHLPTLPPFS